MRRKIYYKNNVKVNEAKILNPEFYLTYPEEMFVYMHKDACDNAHYGTVFISKYIGLVK